MMKRLGKIILIVFILLLLLAAGIMALGHAHANMERIPELESGDLIFQTAVTNQTPAILFATGSSYTHVGVIHRVGDKISVIHASAHVIESPIADFIHSGWGERFTILRYAGLTPAQREAIVAHAEHYLGHPYNYVFHMGTEAIYCSELPYLAFKDANMSLGSIQKIGELNMNNFAVRRLFDERWKSHPSCQGADMTAERCWNRLMDEPIITPIGVTRDAHLTTLYSNYWY